MPGRTSSGSASYRYGFNGKENDNDVKGEGNQQDYGMRIYDPRVGRFLSVDPITQDYPELTPYQFASNRTIDGIDLDGLEYSKSNIYSDATVVRHNEDPHRVLMQIQAAPDRARKVVAEHVEQKTRTQAVAVMTRYREPDIAQKQRNATLQRNYDANAIPENHWTRNKNLNLASERLVTPMFEMAIGDGTGRIAVKGFSWLRGAFRSQNLYRFDTRSLSEITNAVGFKSRGINVDLREHVNGNTVFDKTSGYVSTTTSFESATNFFCNNRHGI